MDVICEVCGSSDIIKHSGFFVCQGCGMKYSLDEIKNMLDSKKQGTRQVNIDVKSTVSSETRSELQNLYTLAPRAKDEDNAENAAKYYSMILVKEPASWEATFYSEYFKAANCRIIEIPSAITSLSNCTTSVFNLIKKNVTSQSERSKFYKEVSSKVIDLASMMYDTEKARCEENVSSISKSSMIDTLLEHPQLPVLSMI